MDFRRLSLRSIIALFMSLMSMILVVMAWEVYRDSALKIQQQSLQEVLDREINRSIQQLQQNVQDMAISAQQPANFRQALVDENLDQLVSLLNEQFQRQFVTSGQVKLIQLYAYGKEFEVLAWSKNGPFARSEFGIICQDMADVAKQRRGVEQLKAQTGLCHWRGQTFLSVIVPVGGIRHQGYLQLVVDPLHNLAAMDAFLQMPVRINLVSGNVVYRSQDWHVGDEGKTYVSASHRLKSDTGQPLAEITLQRQLNLFNQNLTASRNQLMLFAGVVTLLMLALVLWVLHLSTVRPIEKIISQLNRVRNDRHQLGQPVALSGNVELRELVQVFNEMSQELAKAYYEYETLAFTDQLTTLPNRVLFLDRLSQIILLSQRKGEKFGVMLLDLDGFKEINDTLGHHVGDELLKQIAKRLQRIIRCSSTIARVVDTNAVVGSANITPEMEETTIARLGGDEFAILLPNLSGVEGAISVAKRVTETLEASVEIDGNVIVVGGTLGISMFPEHGENANSLLRRADVALYVAKHLQNDFSVYDPAYDSNSVKQLALKAELRSAIEEDQLVLFYQPKLDLARGCVDSVEALVRWQHPERGMIPPDQFIPLSEQRGLIGPLTEWVIQHALQQYKEWQQQGVFLQIAVNLSSRVLYDLSLPTKIEGYLTALQLSPSALSLEITEEATMLDPDRALTILNRLKAMGISLSIDDFGTGHSSLSYLKRLPVAEIKIDRSFVMDMQESDNDAKIVHATIDLAHNLGLKVVAEGVETEAALKVLEKLSCDYAQGYYLSRPVPPDELLSWLGKSSYRSNPEKII